LADFPIRRFTAANKRTVVKDAVREIFEGRSREINEGLFNLYGNNYLDAVTAVFGDSAGEQAQRFKINLARLAAAKTYRVTAELDRLRADKDGVVRKWKDYKPLADKVIKMYNRHQVTEYTTFVNRCRTAEQLERFRQKAHIFPNIKWLQTVSAVPRERHLKLVGLVLPIDHPFWTDNQPGNLYNCKCDWTQTDDPVSTDIPGPVRPDSGLEGNPLLTGEVATDKHPYFRDIPNHVPDVGELMLPDNIAYFEHQDSSGKTWLEHSLLRKEPETERNRTIVEALLGKYGSIKLLPRIHASRPDLRAKIYGKAYADSHPTQCPDALIDGEPVEFKSSSVRNMSRRVAAASGQSNTVVLEVDEPLTEDYLKRFVKGIFNKKEIEVKRIIIITDGRVYLFDRPL
jgi:hypothetical protein